MLRRVLGLFVVAAATLVAGTLVAGTLAADARADSITLEFERISSNATEDVSSQFSVVVSDNGDGQVLFVVHNDGPIASSICDVYWGPMESLVTVLASTVTVDGDTTSATGVSFSDGARPDHAPSGTWDAGASCDSDSPASVNGIGAGETGGFLIAMLTGVDWADVKGAMLAGDLRMAFHVQGIGVGGQSDAYESVVPVPEPTTLAMLGVGLAGLAARARRKTRRA